MSIENRYEDSDQSEVKQAALLDASAVFSSPRDWAPLPQLSGLSNVNLDAMGIGGFELTGAQEVPVALRAEPAKEGKVEAKTASVPATNDVAAFQLMDDLHRRMPELPYGGKEDTFLQDVAAGRIDAIAATLTHGVRPEDRAAFISTMNKALERQGIKLSFGGTADEPKKDEIRIQRTLVGSDTMVDAFAKTENLHINLKDGSVTASKTQNNDEGDPLKDLGAVKKDEVAARMKGWVDLVPNPELAAKIFADADVDDAQSKESRVVVSKMIADAYREFGEAGARHVIESLQRSYATARRVNDPQGDQPRRVSLSLNQTEKGFEANFRRGDALDHDTPKGEFKVDVQIPNFKPNPNFEPPAGNLKRILNGAGVGAGQGGGGGLGWNNRIKN